jgi:hypothetical protein
MTRYDGIYLYTPHEQGRSEAYLMTFILRDVSPSIVRRAGLQIKVWGSSCLDDVVNRTHHHHHDHHSSPAQLSTS